MRVAKAWLVALLPLAAAPEQGAPTGFIDAVKLWTIDSDLSDLDGDQLQDQGSCSKRVEFRADGTVRSVHTYDRTITRKSRYKYPNGRTIETRIVTRTVSGQPFPYPDQHGNLYPNLGPTEYEYQAVSRVMQHRDGTVTLSYRPIYAQINTLQREQTWRFEGAQQIDYRDGRWKPVHEVCDPIEDFQNGLVRNARMVGQRRLGRLPALTGSDSVRVQLLGRNYPPGGYADLTASWSLKP